MEENFSDEVEFLDPYHNKALEFQVLFPDLVFPCHGYISNWSALTALDPDAILVTSLYIRLQIWRPSMDQPDAYVLVDSYEKVYNGPVYPNFNNTRNLYKLKEGPPNLYFKQNDTIGFFIYYQIFGETLTPLSITFRNATAQETNAPHGGVSRMYVKNSTAEKFGSGDQRQPCSVSRCAEKTTIYSAVVPQLQINYGWSLILSL